MRCLLIVHAVQIVTALPSTRNKFTLRKIRSAFRISLVLRFGVALGAFMWQSDARLHFLDGVVAQLVERFVRNEEVRGSNPLGSTSLRSQHSENEGCRAQAQRRRAVTSTCTSPALCFLSRAAKFRPWKIKTAIAFTDKTKAMQFERYLKTASGRAFAKKRL